MRCKKEEFVEDAVFHLYNHSVESLLLFRNRDDYIYFLNKFKKAIIKYPASIYAYCLMPNHFHFCIKQNSDKQIYRIFNDSFASYALHYNFKYKRKGTLFQGHLQHKKVNHDGYLVQLCKYIHYNPKKADLVTELSEWEFSNYLEFIGIRKGDLFTKKLLVDYKDDFENYKDTITEYEKYLEDSKFREILFDH